MEEKIFWGKVISNQTTQMGGSFSVLDKQYLIDRKLSFAICLIQLHVSHAIKK